MRKRSLRLSTHSQSKEPRTSKAVSKALEANSSEGEALPSSLTAPKRGGVGRSRTSLHSATHLIEDEKVVKLHIKKSKTDQKGLGTWRTLTDKSSEAPLFPDRDAGVKAAHGDFMGLPHRRRHDGPLCKKIRGDGIRQKGPPNLFNPVPREVEAIGRLQICGGSYDRDSHERGSI